MSWPLTYAQLRRLLEDDDLVVTIRITKAKGPHKDTLLDIAASIPVTQTMLRSRQRTEDVVAKRRKFIKSACAAGFTQTEIAVFINRDRTTVTYNNKAHEPVRDTESSQQVSHKDWSTL